MKQIQIKLIDNLAFSGVSELMFLRAEFHRDIKASIPSVHHLLHLPLLPSPCLLSSRFHRHFCLFSSCHLSILFSHTSDRFSVSVCIAPPRLLIFLRHSIVLGWHDSGYNRAEVLFSWIDSIVGD